MAALDIPLARRLREAAEWCAGIQAHTVYTDADYVGLFREAANAVGTGCAYCDVDSPRYMIDGELHHPTPNPKTHVSCCRREETK